MTGLTSTEPQYSGSSDLKTPLTTTQKPQFDLEDFYCILQIQPNDSFMALELSKRLQKLGRIEETAKILRSVLKIDYRFSTLSALGLVEYQLENFDAALDHLHAALAISQDSSDEFFEIFKTLGNIYTRKGDFEAAEENYNKAHRLHSESDVLFVNFGALYMQRQRWEDALIKYRRALEINSRNDKAWVGLALSHRMKGDVELAWGNIEAALEYNPLNEVALGLALDWSTQQGREFRALELMRRFLIQGGWSERFSLAFSWLAWRRGETNVAMLELERLTAVNPMSTKAIALLNEIRRCGHA